MKSCCTSTTSSTAKTSGIRICPGRASSRWCTRARHFANRKVRDFVPLLVERLAREKLQALVPT
ncbi:three-helix bundle dimerization domain-containing protein [Rhodococcus opacus]|uniref:three-helix bundle dimerization domain-containing protein n=1 Tax=Rhodococcus TaxID=1827 RepID=UPI00352E496C